MIGLGDSIVVEHRGEHARMAKWTEIKGVRFPTNVFEAALGTARLADFHRSLGETLAAMTEEQRQRAYVMVRVDDDGRPEHVFGYYRVETEDEYAVRVEQEEARKMRRQELDKEHRRQLYEELRQEFEGT